MTTVETSYRRKPANRALAGGALGSLMLLPGALQDAYAAGADPVRTQTSEQDESIRPFKIDVPQSQLDDLRRRIAETRWPDKETVGDISQGIQLDRVQKLVKYWGTGYDWRKAENDLNALPEFITKIDGVDIQFIHVRSRQPNALPLLLTHGWPGSQFEFIKSIGPLTDPTAYGGRAEDAFDVVIHLFQDTGFPASRLNLAGARIAWPRRGTFS